MRNWKVGFVDFYDVGGRVGEMLAKVQIGR